VRAETPLGRRLNAKIKNILENKWEFKRKKKNLR
jgi:hypothetical protein